MDAYWRNEKHDLTIYHGDCLEVMPQLDRQFDLCLTDPPYGLNFRGASWDAKILDWLSLARERADLVVFTTAPTTQWDYPRPDWVICWQRPAAQSRSCLGGGFNHWTPVLVYGKCAVPVDCVRLNARNHMQAPGFPHPTPKPIGLMTWLMYRTSPPGAHVLDPFLGSGMTLIACYRLGRTALGIEICEEYCDLAARRLEQEIAEGRMFEPVEFEQNPKQEVLLPG